MTPETICLPCIECGKAHCSHTASCEYDCCNPGHAELAEIEEALTTVREAALSFDSKRHSLGVIKAADWLVDAVESVRAALAALRHEVDDENRPVMFATGGRK